MINLKTIVAPILLAAGVLELAQPAAGQGLIPVEIELVLAIDVSASVDDGEYRLQMEGTALALQDPSVISIIGGLKGGVAVTLVHWSAAHLNRQAVGWHVLQSPESVVEFARLVHDAPRIGEGNATALGPVIDYSAHLVDRNIYQGRLRKLDISGDGRSNSGPRPTIARDDAVRRGFVINALPVLDADDALGAYFRDNIIGGPGAFVIEAVDFPDFADAMRVKLIRELSPPVAGDPPGFAQLAGRRGTGTDEALP